MAPFALLCFLGLGCAAWSWAAAGLSSARATPATDVMSKAAAADATILFERRPMRAPLRASSVLIAAALRNATLLQRPLADRRQGRRRGDHLFRKPELQKRGNVCGERALECGRELLGAFDGLSERAEGARVRRKVGVLQMGAVDAARILALLVHADGAVAAIVDDDQDEGQPVLDGGGELLPGHQEVSVAGEADHQALRMHRLRGHGGGHAV